MNDLEHQDWYARRTFTHERFADIERLIGLKRELGVSISVCLPTRNESETLESILSVLSENLMGRNALIDELALMDAGSTDGTVDIARANGVPVFEQEEVLEQYGNSGGKGEALWKSLYCLSGDIIVWIDSDIRNIHPRFVYGLVGPLLEDPAIGFVKAFYQRPLLVGDRLEKTGGGRVTELVARPLLNLFYPELSGLIQPLSGEYAGRREVLDAIPFFTGYGVEIGILVDMLRRFGIDAIAQVDMVERVHRNQDLPDLGLMSFEIMQAVLQRLAQDSRIEMLGDYSKVFNMVRFRNGEYVIEKSKSEIRQKPPMSTVPGYCARFPERQVS